MVDDDGGEKKKQKYHWMDPTLKQQCQDFLWNSLFNVTGKAVKKCQQSHFEFGYSFNTDGIAVSILQ